MQRDAKLLDVLQNSTNWDDIYDRLHAINCLSPGTAGRIFEQFCKLYYQIEPSLACEYSQIWLFADVPIDIRTALNLGSTDHGIDLVLEARDGRFSAIQCKFKSNQCSTIGWTKDRLANLLADGDKADTLIVFTNASTLDRHSLTKGGRRLKFVGYQDLISLTELTIHNMRSLILGETTVRTRKTPRPDQQLAIEKVLIGLDKHNRGQLILPCGAGKTLTALWIKEALASRRTLLLFPSLALLRQTKKEWAENAQNYIPYISVCSEDDINSESEDEIQNHISDITGSVSTNPETIRDFFTRNDEILVYSTYHSLGAIQKAIHSISFAFDLIVCDEAHKTSGARSKEFALVHDNEAIPSRKRLYMTATPTILAPAIKNKLGPDHLEYIADMSNTEIFGLELHRMAFEEAVEQKVLVDYKIVVIGVSDKELHQAIKQRRYVSSRETADEVAHNYALEKFFQEHEESASHAITFHSKIKGAQQFLKRQQITASIPCFHVNGSMSTHMRARLLRDFKNLPKAIMTNARCLTEGVDVPSVDVVYFADPKYSKIDIVQAVGRAMRTSPSSNKSIGYVVIPIFHNDANSPEEKIVNNSSFKHLLNVIRALCSHDSRLVAEINAIRSSKGERRTYDHISFTEASKELVAFVGFDEITLVKHLFCQEISRIAVPWRNFEKARAYVHNLGLKNKRPEWDNFAASSERPIDIPYDPYNAYKGKGWVTWGHWLGTYSVAPRKMEFLSFKEARTFARALAFTSRKQWQMYCQSGQRPKNIPACPNETYENEGWVSMPDWLGTNKPKQRTGEDFLPFLQAREYVRSLNFKRTEQWKDHCRRRLKPENIPTKPDEAYKKKGWISWIDWIELDKHSPRNRKWRSFEETREYVRSLNLTNQDDYRHYSKSGKRQNDIPSSPFVVYNNQGWISWEDFLGTGYRGFEAARSFVRTLGLKTNPEWVNYCTNGKKPTDIPRTPDRVYADHWHSWGDWLGTEKPSNEAKNFRPFIEARAYVRAQKFQNGNDWREHIRNNNKPHDIPSDPSKVYLDNGWISWPDWFGTKTTSPKRTLLLFDAARAYVHQLNLRGESNWRHYSKSANRPDNIPAKPERVYKNKGWISWPHWLGTDTLSPSTHSWLPFGKARSYAHSLQIKSEAAWRRFLKTKKKPINIPAKPDQVYRGKGWISWRNWLGN